jgi:hypothetical protein
VKKIRISKKSRRPEIEVPQEALRRNDVRTIGAHAEYRREDYFFLREQSEAMKSAEWESRLPPMKPWGINAVANLAWDIFA